MTNVEDTSGMNERQARKRVYKAKLLNLLGSYNNILMLNIDNVGSRQLQLARIKLRGRAEFLMGKNTIIRKVLRDECESRPELIPLLEAVRGNIGFCFTNDDLNEIRERIQEERVPAGAKSGQFAPDNVYIPAGPTPLDPGQTSFFQALNISTKISRGAIEIINRVHLVVKGERVTASAVALLTKLGIKPFFFGIKATHVYENGSFYEAAVLDLSEQDLINKFLRGCSLVAQMSLALQFPTAASLPHSIARAFQYCVSYVLETGYSFEEAVIYKEMVENPDAFAAAAAPAGDAEEADAPAAEPEEEDEEEEEAAAALFGEDEEGY